MTAHRPTLISEETVARLPQGARISATIPYVITPSAAELIRHRRITVVPVEDTPAPEPQPQHPDPASDAIVTAAESGGYALAESGGRDLAGYLESTLLDPCATPRAIEALCLEARALRFCGVCVNPLFVRQAAGLLAGSGVRTVTVCGFPLGASCAATKAFEAGQAASDGAQEVDMVLALGPFLAGDHQRAVHDVREVKKALGADGRLLKVIIETPLLSPTQIVQAAVVALEGGADFVKTGTGLRGPARVEDVELIRRVIRDRARIKAAGGIRSREGALALIAAGAHRLGTSRAKDLL